MKILGISAFYHDSAAAIIIDGNIVAAAQEERFSRIKNDASFPAHAIRFCLQFAGIEMADLDAIAFYDKPLLKFERLLESYYSFAPRGLNSFLAAMPVWMGGKLFPRKTLYKELTKIGSFSPARTPLLFPEHHLSHAASAFFPSPFEEAAILTIDAVGEWATASISVGKSNEITVLKELRFPHSPGLLYSAFTYYLGFKVNSGEYKVMGLAPYAHQDSPQVLRYLDLIRTNLVSVFDDGSIWLNQEFFNYGFGLRMTADRNWEKLFNFPKRNPDDEIRQHHCDLAMAAQLITEEIVLKMAGEAKKLTGSENLCMAGGVALNCVANGKLSASACFKNIFIQPAAGDAGGAIGSALAAFHIYFGKTKVEHPIDGMNGGYLGPSYHAEEIKIVADKFAAPYTFYTDPCLLNERVAELLSEGMVVGWFRGRMEFGPRALGNRSILADPRNPAIMGRLNLNVKQRERFRPFGPSVLAEYAKEYFECGGLSPYMLFTFPVRHDKRLPVPEGFENFTMTEKLRTSLSIIPAVTHVDFSSRIQTVHKSTNPAYWNLLDAFRKKTGSPVLLNTSFNIQDEPLVCDPENAYRCFMKTDLDFLVLENFMFSKQEQPKILLDPS